MKKLFFLCISLAISIAANSQDVIIKKTGDEIKVKIVEIGINEIKYRRFDFQDGPVYTISKTEVVLVKYENGINEVITSGGTTTTPTTPQTVIPPPTNPTPTPTPEVVSEKIDYLSGSYNQNGRYISKTRVISILRTTNDAEIRSLLRKSNTAKVTGNILAAALGIPLMVVGTGATLVGIGKIAADTDPDATGVATVGAVLAGTGIVLQFVNIGFQAKSRKNMQDAVAIYNNKYADKPKQ